MSALAVPPSPRLRAASAASAEAAVAQRLEGVRAGRPHLRLVTPGFVPEQASTSRGAKPVGPAPVKIGQRATKRAEAVAGSQTSSSAAVTRERPAALAAASLQELAPRHPAVRAQRRCGEAGSVSVAQESVERGQVRLGSVARPARACEEHARVGLAQASTVQESRQAVPAALRRLVVLACAAVLGALLVAGGIVLSGLISEPVAGGTTTVQQGESLWDIASATGAQDVSAAVSQIVELNNLESTTLQPGQTLILPAS